MLDILKAHELSRGKGIALSKDFGLFCGTPDPATIDQGVPQSSLYVQKIGSLWQKIGPLVTDWLLLFDNTNQVSLRLPFYLETSTREDIQLTVNNKLPFYLEDGSREDIELIVV